MEKEPIEEDEEIDADDVAQENKGLTEEDLHGELSACPL